MKAGILAGGLGTRLSEETEHRPKPMVEIGDKPILWHIMKIYSVHGIEDFIICLGYKGYVIKEWFANYFLHNSDVTINMRDNSMSIHQGLVEPWQVTLIDTGEATMIGGRIKQILPFIGEEAAFCLTYGDGVGDIDISKAIALHRDQQRLAASPRSRPGVSVHCVLREIASPAFRKSRSATGVGSTAVSSCSLRG